MGKRRLNEISQDTNRGTLEPDATVWRLAAAEGQSS